WQRRGARSSTTWRPRSRCRARSPTPARPTTSTPAAPSTCCSPPATLVASGSSRPRPAPTTATARNCRSTRRCCRGRSPPTPPRSSPASTSVPFSPTPTAWRRRPCATSTSTSRAARTRPPPTPPRSPPSSALCWPGGDPSSSATATRPATSPTSGTWWPPTSGLR
ncbi:MAG: UDP-glucose 4-epimerase, partial [uncultured Thermomicrobiales bacterium]